jgi:hypothetical protein
MRLTLHPADHRPEVVGQIQQLRYIAINYFYFRLLCVSSSDYWLMEAEPDGNQET